MDVREIIRFVPVNRDFPDRGFTLLELMLSLALSVLVVLLLISGSNLITREWHKKKTRLDEKIADSITLLQIERALEGAFPHLYRDEPDNKIYKKS